MFDELKDPRPPQVTDVHIVSVIARAHRIRRRQRVAMFTTTAAFAGAIAGLAFVSRGHSPSNNIDFAAGASTDPSFAPVVLATTIAFPAATLPSQNGDEEPSLTELAVALTEAPAVADDAPDDSSFHTRTSGAVDGAATLVSTIPSAAVSTVQVVAQPTTPIPTQFVAVTAETGDLVRVDTATGATTVLVSALRPDPGSAGGAVASVLTAGGITPDGATAYYTDSTSAMVHAVSIATPEPAPPAWGPGTEPKLSPNGLRWIVRNSDSTISVHSKSESDQTLGNLPRSTVVDYAWYGDDEVALLEHDGNLWTVSVVDVTLTQPVENSSTIDDPYVAGGPDAVNMRFVGRTVNGLLLTAQRRSPGPDDLLTVHLWVRPGPGSEDRWSSPTGNYTDITVDRNGEWLLRLAVDGTLTTDAVGGHEQRKVAGAFTSVAW